MLFTEYCCVVVLVIFWEEIVNQVNIYIKFLKHNLQVLHHYHARDH